MKKHVARISMVVFVGLAIIVFRCPADVRLPAVIGDNMVLQRDTLATIWGWAEPGEQVMVKGDWQSYNLVCWGGKDGKWRVRLATPGASGPYKVTISGKNTIVLNDVMIGEVWVCSGQSNMEFALRSSFNAEAEIAAANWPKIRLFHVKRTVAAEPQADCQGAWAQCNPETVAGFSAVAYFFGRRLHKELNVPIGLIATSWGGTPAEAWTRRKVLESDDICAPILTRFDKILADYPTAKKVYDKNLKQWEEAAKTAKDQGKPLATRRPRRPKGPNSAKRPASLYNGMIAPLIQYAIRGAIWYQGESNASRAYQYRTLFPMMIANWRADWQQGDFPFYFVQIAPCKGMNPEIREAQLLTMLSVPNTGMAVTTDIGNPTDIHPRNKRDVGKRLALWALNKTYGQKDTVCSGPIYKSMRVEGDKIRVFFDHVGSGLVAKGGEPGKPGMLGKSGELTDFTIAQEDGDFVPAKAVIDGDTVVVRGTGIQKPAAVRFGWTHTAEPNFFNVEGLPASPFRSDDRPGITAGVY